MLPLNVLEIHGINNSFELLSSGWPLLLQAFNVESKVGRPGQ